MLLGLRCIPPRNLDPDRSQARAALSLLAYCQYQVGEFAKAAENYADLIKQFPEVMCYQLYHAQALFKACEFEEAWGATLKVTGDELPFEVLKLQAAIKFNDEELNEARYVRVARPCTATVPYFANREPDHRRYHLVFGPLFPVGPRSEAPLLELLRLFLLFFVLFC